MRIPVRLFDLFLAGSGPAAASLAREPEASKAVGFLKELATLGQLLDPAGVLIDPAVIRYEPRSAVVELRHESIAAARASGVNVDDAALETAFHEKLAAADPEPEPDPVEPVVVEEVKP
jgi:hypothetical protein